MDILHGYAPGTDDDITKPFYRAEQAHNRENGGNRLGLAIVEAVVELHGGICGAENLSDGVHFWMNLPTNAHKGANKKTW